VPGGSTNRGQNSLGIIGLPGAAAYAPLTVMLAPYPLESPQAARGKKTPRPAKLAAATDTQGRHAGLGDNRTATHDAPPLPASDTDTSGIPVPRYYEPRELTQRATILREIDMFLGELKDEPGSGKAIIRLWINENGTVDQAETESSALSEVFEHAVLAQFAAARFRPAERDGLPVKSLMRVEVEILPRSRFSQSVAEGSSPTP
jgi:TonB family protein